MLIPQTALRFSKVTGRKVGSRLYFLVPRSAGGRIDGVMKITPGGCARRAPRPMASEAGGRGERTNRPARPMAAPGHAPPGGRPACTSRARGGRHALAGRLLGRTRRASADSRRSMWHRTGSQRIAPFPFSISMSLCVA